jgi:hypothetical protein
LLVALLESLEREALGLADPAAGVTIPARVEQASTWIRGRTVEVHGPQACVGVTAGLDEHGFLLVQHGRWFGDRADRWDSHGWLRFMVSHPSQKTRWMRHPDFSGTLRKTMLLAIDVGNTNTVLGLYKLEGEKPELAANWRVTTTSLADRGRVWRALRQSL